VGAVGAVRGTRVVSGAEIKQLNTGLLRFGETADPVQAAAMNAVVYAYSSQNHSGYDGGLHYIRTKAPRESGLVTPVFNEIWGYIQANWNVGAADGGGGHMTFDVDRENNYRGSLVVGLFPGDTATGSVTLTNGVFVATGGASISGVRNGDVHGVVGVPPEGESFYKISAHGSFAATVGGGGGAENVTLYETPGQQRLIAAGTPGVREVRFDLSAIDPMPRSTVFQPVVGTKVASTFVQKGDVFQDVLTFSTAADSTGLNNPWRRRGDGTYVEVVAKGVLYGPFTYQPGEAAVPPVGAPVAGTAVVTTSEQDGPTVPYTVSSSAVAEESGFYTWVWSIKAEEQTDFIKKQIPVGYVFVDRFGQVAETSVVPSTIMFETRLVEAQVTMGGGVADVITPALAGGAWLTVDGARVPVTVTGTTYFSPNRPEVSALPPAGAEAVSTHTAVLTGLSPVMSEPIIAPYRAGFLTVQWCVVAADQPAQFRGMVDDYCDRYGVPSETVEVVGPTFATLAQQEATPQGTVSDTVIVTGPVPAVGVEVTFEGFLQPKDAPEATCTAETRVFQSAKPLVVVEPGSYESENFTVTAEHLGELFWVETARIRNTDTIIHQGRCGEMSETTTVRFPKVSTRAVRSVVEGDMAYDTAIVDGPTVPGSTVGFTAYKQADPAQPVCVPGNAVFTTFGSPVLVNGSGEYDSTSTVLPETGNYFWVHHFYGPDGALLNEGACGEPDETTVVTAKPVEPPPLTESGSDMVLPLMVGGGLLAVGSVALLVRRFTRRNKNSAGQPA